MSDPVAEVCLSVFGISYLYPWQRLIIAGVLDAALTPADTSGDRPEPLRQIAVLPTGAGKSLCWMLPAVMSKHITVAVFPLLSLMADQERRLAACGIPSVVFRGGQSREERNRSWKKLEQGEVRIVLANPEVLQVEETVNRLGRLGPGFLVIDETHTVSQWGESFRPACAEMGRLVETWNPPAVLALTATAGPRIRERLKHLVFNGETPSEALADPDRPAIRYGVYPTLSRFHALDRLVRQLPRPAIVFGSSRSGVEQAARMLRRRLKDDSIRYYHAGLSREEKNRLESWFLSSDSGILCATCAYGMGVDKKNIRTVIHLSPPSSVEAYLQESGRASRDGKGAEAWLIWTPEDEIDDRLFPTVPDRKPGGTATAHTPPRGSADATARTAAGSRRATMIRYVLSTDRCRREMLLEALGIESQDCSGCDVCGGEPWSAPPEEEVILRAIRWNNKRYNKGQMSRILIGRLSAEIRRTGLDLARGFESLGGWELEDAETAIDSLVKGGKIRMVHGRSRVGRLAIRRSRATRRSPLPIRSNQPLRCGIRRRRKSAGN